MRISTNHDQKCLLKSLSDALHSSSYLFGSLSVWNLIISQGRTEVYMKLNLISVALGLPLGLVLIPRLGIIGLVVTALIDGIPSLIAMLWYVGRHYAATVDWVSSTKILSASTISALAAYLILSQLSLPSWMELIIGATVFLTAYITVASLIGAVNRTDIENIKEMLKELGPLSKLLSPPLNLIEKRMLKIHKT
ncbi:MAG: polysaccharide biosynthesis C-terminal domain-containing protein [Nitrososphaeria archaeon]|jgi:O-antigen/teichoic acid export membrane protein